MLLLYQVQTRMVIKSLDMQQISHVRQVAVAPAITYFAVQRTIESGKLHDRTKVRYRAVHLLAEG